MPAFDTYIAALESQFHQIIKSQRSLLETAAAWVADSVGRQRFLFIFGTGHSHLLALEPFYRAGGLARQKMRMRLDPPQFATFLS